MVFASGVAAVLALLTLVTLLKRDVGEDCEGVLPVTLSCKWLLAMPLLKTEPFSFTSVLPLGEA